MATGPRRSAGSPSGHVRAGGIVAALAGVALLLAACSSTPSGAGVASIGSTTTTTTTSSSAGTGSGPGGTGGSGGRPSLLPFALCMRKHGLSDFPEPNAQGNIQIHAGPGSDLNPSSSQFKAAQKACQSLAPGGDLTPAQRQQQLARALKFSNCMRAHGLPDFPEPNSNGGISIQGGPGSDLNPQSPKFQAAQKACRGDRGGPGPKTGGIGISITARAPAPGSGNGQGTGPGSSAAG